MLNHKVLLAKEIFNDIKWWIIVLGASLCKSLFCNHQRCVYIPLSSRSLETNIFGQFRPAGVRSCIYFISLQNISNGYKNSQFWGQDIVVTVLGEDGQVFAPDWHSRAIFSCLVMHYALLNVATKNNTLIEI